MSLSLLEPLFKSFPGHDCEKALGPGGGGGWVERSSPGAVQTKGASREGRTGRGSYPSVSMARNSSFPLITGCLIDSLGRQ